MDPKLPDAEKIRIIYDLVLELKRNLELAMPRDDDNNVDYSGHRKFHKEQNEKEKEAEEARQEIRKNLITWAIVGFLTIIGSGLVQAYVVPVLALIGK